MFISRKEFLRGLVFPLIKRYLVAISNIILPPRCCSCGALAYDHHHVCSDCWTKLTFISQPQCHSCGCPLPFDHGDSRCGRCLLSPPIFDGGWSVFVYKDLIRSLVIRFKHGDATYLAPIFARWLHTSSQLHQEQLSGCDYLIPVPMHRWRLLKRRYNQATLLVRYMSPLMGIPILARGLERVRSTDTQHKKSRAMRKENVKGAFKVGKRNIEKLKGKTVCLVDDVWTTGATLDACAKALKAAGAKKVYVMSLARVVAE